MTNSNKYLNIIYKNKFLCLNNYVYVLFIILCFGCKNKNKKATLISSEKTQTTTSIQGSKFDFINSIPVTIPSEKMRIKIWSPRFSKTKEITKENFYNLKLEKIFDDFSSNHRYNLLGILNFSTNHKTLVIKDSNNDRNSSIWLINYNFNYEIIDYLLVSQEGGDNMYSNYSISTYISSDKIYIENLSKGTIIEYLLDKNGKFKKNGEPVSFQKFINLIYSFSPTDLKGIRTRNVKAENGLIVRDSINKPIGKINFGEVVHIINYSKETITIKDEGKIIKGRKAKILFNKYSKEIDSNVDRSFIGYVFSGFLYQNNPYYNENESHYSYDALTIAGNSINADLSELFDITEVDLKKYRNQIIQKPKFRPPPPIIKKNKKIELTFENGKKLTLKDTTYNSEYSPTRSYNVSFHPDFKNAYLVSESMFFTDEIYSVISKKNGDTINQFNGYPHISPNKSYSVSVFPDWTECNQQTNLVINKLKDNKYINYAYIAVNSWSYPLKLNSNGVPIDDFSIYWLSDNEFIIRVKNPEECYLGKVIKPFYLKYKIK